MQKWGLLWLLNMHSSTHCVVCGYFSWLKCNYANILTTLDNKNKKLFTKSIWNPQNRLTMYLHLMPTLQHTLKVPLFFPCWENFLLSGLLYCIPIFCAIYWWTFSAFSFMNQSHFKPSTLILSQPFDSAWITASVMSIDSTLPLFTALDDLLLWSA